MANKHRRTIAIFAVMAFVLGFAGAASAATAPTSMAIPAGIDLDKYPIFEKPLTQEEVARLGLRLKRFNNPAVGFNYHRSIERFVYEQFTIDAMFYVDAADRPIYLVECGNRVGNVRFLIVLELPRPIAPPTSWLERRGKALNEFGDWLWDKFFR